MINFQNVYGSIGNESLEALYDVAISNTDSEDTPGYEEITNSFHELIERIADENLRSEFERIESQASTLIMYQGFVLGFKEAVHLLTT